MVPKPIVANSSFVTYKYGKNKLGVEVRKNKKRIKKRYIDSQPIKSKYFPLKPIFENGIDIKYAFAAVSGTRLTDSRGPYAIWTKDLSTSLS